MKMMLKLHIVRAVLFALVIGNAVGMLEVAASGWSYGVKGVVLLAGCGVLWLLVATLFFVNDRVKEVRSQ